MEVARSGYYKYVSTLERSIKSNETLLSIEIKSIYKESRSSYGTRRIVKSLEAKGYKIGRFKVRRLMREIGLTGRQKKRYVTATASNHPLNLASNLLNRKFDVADPNKVWASDTTYIETSEGWLYLAVVLDLFSRRVIGWAMSDNNRSELVTDALMMAYSRRRPHKGFMHHSDQGVQYASIQYQRALQAKKAVVSMSRRGNCWDNAVAERFFGILKTECVAEKKYRTREEAKRDLIDFIELFYNNRRLHSKLGYVSPAQFELNHKKSL